MQIATFYSRDKDEHDAMVALFEGYEAWRQKLYPIPAAMITACVVEMESGVSAAHIYPEFPVSFCQVIDERYDQPPILKTILFTPKALRIVLCDSIIASYWHNKEIWAGYLAHLKLQSETAALITKEIL